jgi:predicted O-methyltransferase YrrM
VTVRAWVGKRFEPKLPPEVAAFYHRAYEEAERLGDDRAMEEASADTSLAWLLHFARRRRLAAEIGTSAAWATIALALADSERRVLSYDPFPHPNRARYLSLAPGVDRRIEFVEDYGESGPPQGRSFDFLFIDEAHEHVGVVNIFKAWRSALVPGAVVAFHDYHETWPGVISAVQELGLKGKVRATTFIWRAPR